MHSDVLIVGGGLSGLALADALEQAGVDWMLVEARGRFGGRIKSAVYDGQSYDLGPAWFWPGQPRIAALVERLGLSRFDQHYVGTLSYEDENGLVHRGQGFASMQGSWRLDGGLAQLTDGLAALLPKERLNLNAKVTGLTRQAELLQIDVEGMGQFAAKRVILALPPRVVAKSITFSPALGTAVQQTMIDVPTWMAGQAKAVAIYDTPFWRNDGLSGDAMSRHGPLAEIHDASPMGLDHGALFGFVGIPAATRLDETVLKQKILAQLTRIFGEAAADPKALIVKDWAFDPFTATVEDQRPLYQHPTYSLPPALRNIWDRRVGFAGTEVAPEFGGYLEGALEAAENAARALTDTAVSRAL